MNVRRYVGILPDKDLIREYTDAWVCPDVDEITILNYPSLYQDGSGKSFYVTINDCNKAVEIDEKFGLQSYSDVECATADEISDITT